MSDTLDTLAEMGRPTQKGREYEEFRDSVPAWNQDGMRLYSAADNALDEANTDRLALAEAIAGVKAERDEWQGRAIAGNVKRDELAKENGRLRSITPEELAQKFHATYEVAAEVMNYQTRSESAVPWEQVPAQNRALMVATCAEVMSWLTARGAA